MPILNIELAEYRALENRAESAEEREKKLSVEISVLKREHEKEIEQLVKDGKVRCIDIVYKDRFLFWGTQEKRIRNFDDVKDEVYKHFKDGLFKEELEKAKASIAPVFENQIAELRETIKKLEKENESLVNRGLWDRIRNNIINQ